MISESKSFLVGQFCETDLSRDQNDVLPGFGSMDLDELLSFPASDDTAVGIFDLYGEDIELQDAGRWDEVVTTVDGEQDFSCGTDTLSPLPDLSKVESWSNMRHISSSDSIDGTSGGRTRLPQSARELLDKWLDIHKNEPYLKPNDAEALAHLTGLTSLQIKTYVANARARRLSTGKL